MAKEESSVSDIYQGGQSSLDPDTGDTFTGHRMSAGGMGLTTDPRVANVLGEVSSKLATGIKSIELALVSPAIFDAMPKQQLKEINRLSKLTGIDVTVHAPVVEASGFTEQGFNESTRESTERQMIDAIERSHEINPDGSSPVTFHSSAGLPGETSKEGEEREVHVVNSDTGAYAGKLPLKQRMFPGDEEMSVANEIKVLNESQWQQKISQLEYSADKAREYLEHSKKAARFAKAEKKAGKELNRQEEQAINIATAGETQLQDSYRQFRDLFESAYQNGTPEEQKILNEFAKKIETDAIAIKKSPRSEEGIVLKQEIISEGRRILNDLSAPEIFKPLQEEALDKTTETFANVALNSYKKFGDTAPIISIENPPAGGAFSTGEELRQVVEESRKKFVTKAVEEGMSESVAKSQAEKLLGVTWDLGHINMMRKHGYEEEDIVKETEAVAPFVKHVHLSDNFGFEHTELPMGMGNVPVKEMMDKLGEKGFKAKKIIEAAQWWEHFKTPPVQSTMESFGSSLYSMKMAPYWNQSAGLQQGYFSGYGAMLPQINYETFGAGFSQLPMELGGQRGGGEGGRMSGRPME